jgi:hypothetical protein
MNTINRIFNICDFIGVLTNEHPILEKNSAFPVHPEYIPLITHLFTGIRVNIDTYYTGLSYFNQKDGNNIKRYRGWTIQLLGSDTYVTHDTISIRGNYTIFKENMTDSKFTPTKETVAPQAIPRKLTYQTLFAYYVMAVGIYLGSIKYECKSTFIKNNFAPAAQKFKPLP